MTLLVRTALTLAIISATACKKPEPAPDQTTEPAPRRAEPPPAPPVRCQPGERTCVGDSVVQCTASGSLGDTIQTCPGPCREGACVDTCALQDVELIYVVDDDAILYSFDPKKLPGDPFHKIANLTCDARSTVNSMAVDRQGIAWLGYHNGVIHRASIIDGRCSPTGLEPRDAPTTFGMGYVTDGPKATTEKLFLAGGPEGSPSLATLNTSINPVTWTEIAGLVVEGNHPELTGTGDGRVFAYFPSPGRGYIQELDRRTAKGIGTRWNLRGKVDHVSAYAFAHWGGVFYVFTTAEDVSTVHAVHMKDGKQEIVKDKLPMRIVGAGVSTCAPLLERVP